MENFRVGEISARLSELREKHFGPRGKARFARQLGIRSSTYNHYEVDRTPPPQLLVRAAKLTDTSLQWLLTGEGEMTAVASPQPESEVKRLADRLQRLLSKSPELLRSIVGFLDLLEDVATALPELKSTSPRATWSTRELIPVVGSTAAGPARFWAELDTIPDGPQTDARLEQLLEQLNHQPVQPVELLSADSDSEPSQDVSLIQLSQPDALGVVEFLSGPVVKAKYPNAVAWRIDGDSMAPRYLDRDLVITAPEEPAVDAHPCVARQKGQIGVNCKIYRRQGDQILLIPVNESASIQRLNADELLWAQRVLYSVRLSSKH